MSVETLPLNSSSGFYSNSSLYTKYYKYALVARAPIVFMDGLVTWSSLTEGRRFRDGYSAFSSAKFGPGVSVSGGCWRTPQSCQQNTIGSGTLLVLLPLYDHNYAFRFSESQPHYVEVGIIGSVNLNVLPTSHSCRPWQIASTTVVYVGDDESAVVDTYGG
ncbi:hypothetical protein BDR03DRAFT_1001819 [Suillus americanus]|nr:hypothetical protein BDR03DRAFT_1001819 [Suillus americanus]